MRAKALSFVLFVTMVVTTILLHELGHFLAARSQNIAVREVSIGFGPALWNTSDGETSYVLRAVLLGGSTEIVMGKEDPRSFDLASKKSRAITIIAGVFANFLVVSIAAVCYIFYEKRNPILAIILGPIFAIVGIGTLTISIFREPRGLQGLFGFLKEVDKETMKFVKTGKWHEIALMALGLNATLAGINILPIPGLDGGKLLFVAIEVLSGGRQIALERAFNAAGTLLILLFIVLINISDFLPKKSGRGRRNS